MTPERVRELARITDKEADKQGDWWFINVGHFAQLVERETQMLPDEKHDKIICDLVRALYDELLLPEITYSVDYLNAVSNAANLLRSKLSETFHERSLDELRRGAWRVAQDGKA